MNAAYAAPLSKYKREIPVKKSRRVFYKEIEK